MSKVAKPLALRLFSNISINLKTGCWEWLGATDYGYGRIMIGSRTDHTRKPERTHRLSYELCIGEIPNGLFVCHKCDNPSCINPEHLFLGTHAENMKDKYAKGRCARLAGEKNPRAKLTAENVYSMRMERAKAGTSYAKLARKYGVVPSVAQKAVKGEAWKDVPFPQPPQKG